MEPAHDSPSRGRSSERGPITVDDDDWTVCSDMETLSTCSSEPGSIFPVWHRQDATDIFHLKRDEQDKPVYEAWNIHHFPDWRENIGGFKVLGVKVERYEDVEGRVDVNPLPSVQSELAEMHLRGIEHFRAKQKRCWATRPFRGSGKTYEQMLDERCRSLPEEVQTAITQLLLDRGRATSTRHRTRTWTVAVMREQLRHRFADTDFSEVKRHRFRFWKKPEAQAHMLYTIVIRGAQTKEFPANGGATTSTPVSNPWAHADNAEIRRKSRAEQDQHEARRRKRGVFSPPHRARGRSVSPPAYQSPRSRYESPLPSGHNYRSDSPPPYRRCTRTASPVRSRSPVRIRVHSRTESSNRSRSPVRIRVRCRERSFDDGPFPPTPTPPYSYTPPPAVSAFHRPAMPPAAPAFPTPCRPLGNPIPYLGHPPPQPHHLPFTPFISTAPSFIRPATASTTASPTPYTSTAPNFMRPTHTTTNIAAASAAARPPPFHPSPAPAGPYPYPYQHYNHPQTAPRPLNPTPPHPCLACRATRPCPHFPRGLPGDAWPCTRPVIAAPHSHFGRHPACGVCATRPASLYSAAGAAPPSVSAVSSSGSIGPMPPAPNPFSPLTTPSLSSAGPRSVSGSVGRARREVVDGSEFVRRRGSVEVEGEEEEEPRTPIDEMKFGEEEARVVVRAVEPPVVGSGVDVEDEDE